MNTISNFVLELKLEPEKYQADILNKRLELGRQIYNSCLNELYKRYRLMTESKEYCRTIKLPKTDKHKNKTLSSLNIRCGLTEYSLHAFVKPIQHHFKQNIDSFTAQKIATRCFDAFKGVIYHKAKKAHFKKYGEMNSLEGKSNGTGIRFINNALSWNKITIPAILRTKDPYAQMALEKPVNYCRVVRKGEKYYLQLVFTGIPPRKLAADGEIRRTVGTGSVGIDIGTQTIAICSDKAVKLLELAPEINTTNDEIRLLQRRMDRSRRSMNPDKYQPNGTINRSNTAKWVKSKHYHQIQKKLCKFKNKQRAIRKQSHNIMANYIVSLGAEVYVEEMNFRGLQKRAMKTTQNAQGKNNKKKRFGKSLANKAPAMFLTLLNNKLEQLGTKLFAIDTAKVKASQYNHATDGFVKKELGERWNSIDGIEIQRDLYSSFLIMNVNPDLSSVNREKCVATYPNFVRLHDLEIQRIKTGHDKKLASMGL